MKYTANAYVGSLLLLASPAGAAPSLNILHTFAANGSEGTAPEAALIADTQGNLYGTAMTGGSAGSGTVFKYAPATNTFTVLYSFQGGADGANPTGALTFDSNGLLWGATLAGGTVGSGTVYTVDPTTGVETVIYSFTGIPDQAGSADGCVPLGPLVPSQGGPVYGVTDDCGAVDGTAHGTIFSIDPTTGDETILHTFTASDGNFPYDGLTADSSGRLYGVTFAGGGAQGGAAGEIFKYNPSSASYTVLHGFSGSSGVYFPASRPIFGPAGLLFGTATQGAAPKSPKSKVPNAGGIYSVDPNSGAETNLYYFNGKPSEKPWAALALGTDGSLYGLTNETVGAGHKPGTAFSFNPSTSAETLLYNFKKNADIGGGYEAVATPGLLSSGSGSFYGVVTLGLDKDHYASPFIFQLTP